MNLYTFIFLSMLGGNTVDINPEMLYGQMWRLNSQETTETRIVYNRGYSINALEFSEANKLRKMTYWARCGNDSRKTSYADGSWEIVTSEKKSIMLLTFEGVQERYEIAALNQNELVLIPENK